AALGRSGVTATLSVVHGGAEARGAQLDFPTVVYCSDEPRLNDVHWLNERCAREGRSFLAGLIFGGLSIVGPFAKPGKRGCWLCAAMRFTNNLEATLGEEFWRAVALGG